MARLVLIFLSVATIVLAFFASKLEMDYDYEKYFPKDDEVRLHYEGFRKKYGEDSDFLLIALENKQGIFQKDFLQKVKRFGDELLKDTLIEFIASPVHNCGYYKKSGLSGVVFKPYLDLDAKIISEADSLRIYGNKQLVGSVLSSNGKSICLFLNTQSQLNKKEALHLISFVKSKKAEFGFDKFIFSGRVLAQTYFVEKMITELAVFITSSIILLVFFLYISFRSWWGILIPLLIIIVSIIWSVGIMYLTGKSFDLLMVMLPTIIFVVGMSDLVHLLAKYLDELRTGKDRFEALKIAFKEVRKATFLTSLTTAIGFFTLMFANILPIREFGLYAGISVFVAYFLAFTFLPSVLVLVKPPRSLIETPDKNFWDKYLRKWFLAVLKERYKIIAIMVVLGGVGVYTASELKINNFILEDLSNDDPIKKDVLYFEENYSGLRPFEAEIRTNTPEGIWSYEFLTELNKLENYLDTGYTQNGVGFMMSPLSVIKEANFIKYGSKPEDRILPNSERRFKSLLRQMERLQANSKIVDLSEKFNLVAKDEKSCRLAGKIHDVGGLQIKAENQKLEQFLEENINPDILSLKLTGTAVLIDKNNGTLAKNLTLGLILAFGIIALFVGFMFKSFKIALLSLIPNILPLLLVTTVMWLGEIDLKISTSLIFTLAFGIAVDDTIHLLSKYKLERKKGVSHLYALKRSYLSTGKAIIVTSLILVGGFLTLLFSSFTSTFYMGLLVSVTLVIAVVLDLVILPVILLFDKGRG